MTTPSSKKVRVYRDLFKKAEFTVTIKVEEKCCRQCLKLVQRTYPTIKMVRMCKVGYEDCCHVSLPKRGKKKNPA